MAGGIVFVAITLLALFGAGELLIRTIETAIAAAEAGDAVHGEVAALPDAERELRRLRESGL